VITPRANHPETSVFITIAAIAAQFTSIYAPKPQQTPLFIALTLILARLHNQTEVTMKTGILYIAMFFLSGLILTFIYDVLSKTKN